MRNTGPTSESGNQGRMRPVRGLDVRRWFSTSLVLTTTLAFTGTNAIAQSGGSKEARANGTPVTVMNTPLEVRSVEDPVLLVARPALDNGCPDTFSQQIELHRVLPGGQAEEGAFVIGIGQEFHITDVYWEVTARGGAPNFSPGMFDPQPVHAELASVFDSLNSISLVQASVPIDPNTPATVLFGLETVAMSQHLQTGATVASGSKLCASARQVVREKNARRTKTRRVESLTINGFLTPAAGSIN